VSIVSFSKYRPKRLLGGVGDLYIEMQENAADELEALELEADRLERFVLRARQPQFVHRFAKQLAQARSRLQEIDVLLNGDPREGDTP
jgi:hypothetical protein